MDTPVSDFVKKYKNQQNIRFHMPGHKGNSFIGCEALDITEIDGADVLYNSDSIIKMSEENASLIFGTQKTVYSAEGSSLCIRAMLYMLSVYAVSCKKSKKIAAARNVHKTFVTASALLDMNVDWLYNTDSDELVSCIITADILEQYLASQSEKPVAVYVTSPDYIGNIADIKALSDVCKKYDVLLVVDNAHGAYLKFLSPSQHPMDCGADLCCDSAHKTLPVLTGGAYLHISQKAPRFFEQNAENAMSVFASTSPSYLILQSLDLANQYIASNLNEKPNIMFKHAFNLKKELEHYGYELKGNEPLKLTIAPKSMGYSGYEIADILSDNGIICEFADPDFTVFMFSCENNASQLEELKRVLLSLPKKAPINQKAPKTQKAVRVMSLQKALFSPSSEISIEQSSGRISASPTVSCPPAIPVVMSGELIDDSAVRCMKYYGIEKIKVVD